MADVRRIRAIAVFVVAAAVVVGVVVTVVKLTKPAPTQIVPQCTATGYSDPLDPDQASVAAQMVGEVYKSGIAHRSRAAVLVLAGAMQESKLTNLAPGEGDRDSVGVLQQRPSQDWGKATNSSESDTTAAREQRLQDVTEATREFLAKLDTFDGWWKQSVADAVQEVQISADGSLYAQHEPIATAFSNALLGTTPAGLNCTFEAPTKVASTSVVASALKYQLGINTPTATATGVTVSGAGWQTAAWFVANADDYGIASVDYAGKQWTRTGGWKPTQGAATTTSVVATMAVLKKK